MMMQSYYGFQYDDATLSMKEYYGTESHGPQSAILPSLQERCTDCKDIAGLRTPTMNTFSSVSTVTSMRDLYSLSSLEHSGTRTPSSCGDPDETPRHKFDSLDDDSMFGVDETLEELPDFVHQSHSTRHLANNDSDLGSYSCGGMFKLKRVPRVRDFNEICNLEALDDLVDDTPCPGPGRLRRRRRSFDFGEFCKLSESLA